METRILVPKGLQVIVSDSSTGVSRRRSGSLAEEETEKPSSSSGHGETGVDHQITKSSSSSSSSTSSDLSSASDTEVDYDQLPSRNSPMIGSSEAKATSAIRKRRKKKLRNRSRSNIRRSLDQERNFQPNKNSSPVQSQVRICASRLIEKGTIFTGNDGEVQVVHLKGIPAMPRDDVRFIFGCFETITPTTPLTPTSPSASSISGSAATTTSPDTEENFIRLCNWIRFLPSVKANKDRSPSSLRGRGVSSRDSSSESDFDKKNRNDGHSSSNSDDTNDDRETRRDRKFEKKNNLLQRFDRDSRKRSFLTAPHEDKRRSSRKPPFRLGSSSNCKNSSEKGNIIARFVDGRPRFEATTRLVPGTELVAYFDMDSTTFLNTIMGMGYSNNAWIRQATTQQNQTGAISSSSPPPAPSSTSRSTGISSSSSPFLAFGSGAGRWTAADNGRVSDVNRDENRQPFHQTLFSLYPYALHHHPNYYQQQYQPSFPFSKGSLHSAEEGMRCFLNNFGGSGGGSSVEKCRDKEEHYARVKMEGSDEEDEGGNRGSEMTTTTDGPLDLTKLTKDSKKGFSEPLKIGTPFDSPDSNDEVKTFFRDATRISRMGNTKGVSSTNFFSIQNVLKRSSSPTPSPPAAPLRSTKLFQPYAEKGKEEDWKTRGEVRHGDVPAGGDDDNSPLRSTPTSMATPPSSGAGSGHRMAYLMDAKMTSAPPVVAAATMPGLRPILRTRGRERSLLPCEVCGKAFDRPSLLKRHLRTHTGEKPHVCDVCSKGFSTSSSLNTHRRIHSGEKPHQCPICGKRFTASSNLYYHRMTHNKEKPHKCNLCGKSFPTPGDLKSHQYVHSGSWPYTCPVCHRGFSKQTNLRNHLLLHSGMGGNSISSKPGEKPHTCHICEKKFALASNLRAHMKTHEEPESPSSCEICKRSFLPSLNMVINGRCRPCIYNAAAAANGRNGIPIDHHRSSSTASPQNHLNPMEKVKAAYQSQSANMESPLISQSKLMSPNAIPMSGLSHRPASQNSLSSFGLPQFSTFPMVGLPNALSLQGGSALSAPSFHFAPNSTNPSSTHPGSVTAGAAAAASLFRNAGGSSSQTATNPFIEHLLELNYRYAKETAGNLSLGLMQQKLLESQMFAAQLMSSQGFGIGSGGNALQDIFRAASAGGEGYRQLDSAGSENKFMPR